MNMPARTFPEDQTNLLVARGLRVRLGDRAAVDGIYLSLGPGVGVAVVGRSGAGKSTLARALVGLHAELGGSLRFGGRELVGAPRGEWAGLRSRVQLVWQDPASALDPRLTIRAAIDEARLLSGRARWRDGDPALAGLLARVALPTSTLGRLPGELSGGQRQRAALARALAAEPALLIADEITSALDRPVAWAIVELLRELRRGGLGLLMITHDLSLLPGTVDEVITLHEGAAVERGPSSEVLARPTHPATQALLAAAPRLP